MSETREPRDKEPRKKYLLNYDGGDEGARIIAKAELAKHGKWLEAEWWLPNENEMQPRIRINRWKYRIVKEAVIPEEPQVDVLISFSENQPPVTQPFEVVISYTNNGVRGMFQGELKLKALSLEEDGGMLRILLCDDDGRPTKDRNLPLVNILYYDLPAGLEKRANQ